MSDTGIHQFELTDAAGVAHAYLVTEHPGGEGMELMYALLGLGAPTVLGLAGAALKAEDLLRAVIGALRGEGEGESQESDWSELAGLVAGIDFGTVGLELGKALGSGQAPALTKKLVSRVYRDGKPLATVFDRAYQANYIELLQLVWRVCAINRFFPVPSTSWGASLPGSPKIGATSDPSPGG